MADERKKAEHPPWHAPQTVTPLPPLSVLNSLTSQKETFHPSLGNQVGWYICGPTVYDSAHLGHARAYVTFDIVRRIMSDYFNYDVFFVMNITDIDDKIILKARRNHLVADYTARCSSGAVPRAQAHDDVVAALSAALQKLEAKAANMLAAADAQPSVQAEDTRRQAALEAKRAVSTAATIDIVRALLSDDVAAAERVLRQLAADAAATAIVNAVSGENDADGGDEKMVESAAASAAKAAFDAPVDADALTPAALLQRALAVVREPLAEWLDSRFGAEVTDQQIFQRHARLYEAEFLEDMRALGVRESDVLTRVTEYVPDVISFVQRIIANGLGYESGGSVYFDTAAFTAAQHNYAKLAPWAVGNAALQEEGEGALSAGRDSGEKRNAGDFALWKKSKAGEPFWESPWGQGRPGWHIECSAMASDLLGTRLDVHAGGEDLRFPHHDNEIAQCEAFFGCQQWVNYFLHAGHLHIEGLKMSKSLKNFITIREMLKHYSARAIRILFLLQSWHARMNFSKNGLREATVKEKQLKEFFLNVKTVTRSVGAIPNAENVQRWSAADRALHEHLLNAQGSVHRALLDNFDYPAAMNVIFDLINETNKYLGNAQCKVLLLNKVSAFVAKILRVFGVLEQDAPGFTTPGAGAQSSEEALAPVLDAFTNFRAQIRQSAREKVAHELLLAQCDAVRDDVLPEIGVRLEDKGVAGSVWKLDDPAVLIRERDEKRSAARINTIKKLISQQKARQVDLEKALSAAVLARDFIAQQVDKYSVFEADTGLPTHDREGKELSKKNRQFAEKQLAKQTELNAWLATQEVDYVDRLRAEIARLGTEIVTAQASL